MPDMVSPSVEHWRDLEELSELREKNKTLKTVLAEWLDMSESGVLCCGCNSGEGKHCVECGIKMAEKQTRLLLKNYMKRRPNQK
jgi:hypothetical protein